MFFHENDYVLDHCIPHGYDDDAATTTMVKALME